ncbi:peptide MFS transporter [Avrilella dinanensis]|uniref:peptide MFS transporter n=1 Tax=Avrilella dinanensis TaxID=2008672 RepID=UPI00240A69C2|nr:peptide MFS transporter [Avrilella dinanensis]
MATETTNSDFFKSNVLGHPAGLFVLFFTEMWERFSFYGMRVLLINFLTIAVIGSNPGWEWSAENAGALFGTYAGLLYLTPILGGLIADKLVGYRWAVVIGCIIMTLGHASMAFETELSLYAGLALLVIGTGFFKPNITSVISEMYKDLPEKKDGAYTIFYMGVNAGAFFGMMLCGYVAERVGWSYGFGLAGIFMLLGTLQFWLAKPLFGNIGDVPKRLTKEEKATQVKDYKENKFTILDKILIFVTATIGLLFLINDPSSKIGNINLLPQEFLVPKESLEGPLVIVLIGMALFIFLITSRILRYEAIVRDRMFALIIFAFFTVLFFIPFEQAATSMVLFARDYTDRILVGNAALIYNIVNTLLTIGPLVIISWVLFLLYKNTFKKIPSSNIVLIVCFALVWGAVLWMLSQEYKSKAYEVEYQAIAIEQMVNGEMQTTYTPVTASTVIQLSDNVVTQKLRVSTSQPLDVNQEIAVHEELGKYIYLNENLENRVANDYIRENKDSQIVQATVSQVLDKQVEITVSWFSILNSFFIIAFASFFSKLWESKYNPSPAYKFGFGLIIMGIGFAMLAYGASVIPQGTAAGVVRVSMVWLILAYFFHTIGELFLSPLGSSYVSKLVPGRMIAFMFGMWYLAIAIGNKAAGSLGGLVGKFSEEYSLSTFFMLFAIIPAVAGVVVILMNKLLKKLMHGVE